MLTYIRAHHNFLKLQMQPQAVSVYDLSLSKATCVNLGINYLKVTTYVPSGIDTQTSRLQTQTHFVTYLSCDHETEITMPKYRDIVVSDGLAPYLSAGIDPVQEIPRVFCESLLIDSSYHDFEKGEEGRKLSSQLWIHMSGYFIYIFSRYKYVLYFVSLTAYEGRKMNNPMWLNIAGEVMYAYIFKYKFIWLVFHFLAVFIEITALFFITFEPIHLKCVHYGPKFNTTISHNMCHVLGLYFASSHCGNFSLTPKTGCVWNLLESSPDRIPLI